MRVMGVVRLASILFLCGSSAFCQPYNTAFIAPNGRGVIKVDWSGPVTTLTNGVKHTWVVMDHDNENYVDWLYDQVLGPDNPVDREDYWVEALDAGYPRGSVALAFTESWEFVAKTQTTMPLAGYLRWYPEGTHWYCDIGSVTQTVQPLTGEVWADYYFSNRSAQSSVVELWTLEADGRRNVLMTSGALQANFTDYNWDGKFNGDGNYGHSIEVRTGADTNWVVVFYPRTLGPDRLGWQIY